MHIHSSAHPLTHLANHPSIHSSTKPFTCLPMYLSIHPSIHATIYLSFELSTHPSSHPSSFHPIYTSIYPSTHHPFTLIHSSTLLLIPHPFLPIYPLIHLPFHPPVHPLTHPSIYKFTPLLVYHRHFLWSLLYYLDAAPQDKGESDLASVPGVPRLRISCPGVTIRFSPDKGLMLTVPI